MIAGFIIGFLAAIGLVAGWRFAVDWEEDKERGGWNDDN